ncbi:podocan-like [Paramacrobiotus metropolitanus]|uniref:podocan-like n=1 Tax=Paramacrobiotus metropolitanus TaxID=2943436 RepID=UPI002445BC7F|nr:podocan-like [Paramacrobiotus metropolitanus]
MTGHWNVWTNSVGTAVWIHFLTLMLSFTHCLSYSHDINDGSSTDYGLAAELNANASDSSHLPPEVSCPEYCVCSAAESTMSCNGEHIFPFPVRFPATTARVALKNFRKNDLHPGDMDGLLSNASHLQELRLQHCGLNVVRNSALQLLKGLKRLDLSENRLSQISNLTFIGLSSLLYLDLSSNRIAAIDPASFAYLRDLIRLDLNANKLTKLPNDLLTGLVSLHYLNLEVNHIGDIHTAVFSPTTQLVHLNLAMNPIQSVEKVTLELPHLQYADFSHNRLSTVPQNLPVTIRDIRLSGNKLSVLNRQMLGRYRDLAILVADDCNITSIANDTFADIHALQRIWLNGNQLREVPTELPVSLRALYLDENSIRLLSRKHWRMLPDVEEIHLRRNQITSIEYCAFCDVPRLHLLDLRANRLEMLNDTLFPLVNSLSTLDLSANPLGMLGKNFLDGLTGLKQLEVNRVDSTAFAVEIPTVHALSRLVTLDVSGSPAIAAKLLHLAAITNDSSFLPKLHTINLRNTNLALLGEELFPFFARLSRIKLVQNWISCSLWNKWLIQMIQTDTDRFFKAQDLKCASPKVLKDRKILTINSDTLRHYSFMEAADFPKAAKIFPLQKTTTLSFTIPPSLPSADYSSGLFPAEIWIIIVVCSVMTALVMSVVFCLMMKWCPIGKLRWKQRFIRSKIARILGGRQELEPVPHREDIRAWYDTCSESVYTITSEAPVLRATTPSEVFNIDHEFPKYTFQQGIDNDGLSTSSTIRTYAEYRV